MHSFSLPDSSHTPRVLPASQWERQIEKQLNERIGFFLHPELEGVARTVMQFVRRIHRDHGVGPKQIEEVFGSKLLKELPSTEKRKFFDWDHQFKTQTKGDVSAKALLDDLIRFTKGLLVEEVHKKELDALSGSCKTFCDQNRPNSEWDLKDFVLSRGENLQTVLSNLGVGDPAWWFARQVGAELPNEWLQTARFRAHPRIEIDLTSRSLEPVERYYRDLPSSMSTLFYYEMERLIQSRITRHINTGRGMESMRQDAFQEGFIYACRGYEKFRPGEATRSTYLIKWMDAGIEVAMDNTALSSEAKKQIKELKQLEESLSGPISEEALAARLGWSVETLKRVQKKREMARPISLNQPIGANGKGRLEDFIPQKESKEPRDLAQIERLLALLEDETFLNPRERAIVIEMFGLSGESEKSSNQIAEALGVSGARVREIKKAVFGKLKKRLTSPATSAILP